MNQETVLNVADYFVELTKNRSDSMIMLVVCSKFNLDSSVGSYCVLHHSESVFNDVAYSKDHIRYDQKNGFSKHEFVVINVQNWLYMNKILWIMNVLTNFVKPYCGKLI